MKIEIWTLGKTTEAYLREGETTYLKRLQKYLSCKMEVLPEIKLGKNVSPELQMQKEKDLLHKYLKKVNAYVVLLDETGKEFTSPTFANHLQKLIQQQGKILFIIGGAYGFDPEIKALANEKIALSQMTFSHQMVRLFLLEQLYRAMTILNNEKYHH